MTNKTWHGVWKVIPTGTWLDSQNWKAIAELTTAMKYMRRVRGFSREQLAELMGCEAELIRQIEEADADYWQTLVDYCHALGGKLDFDFYLNPKTIEQGSVE